MLLDQAGSKDLQPLSTEFLEVAASGQPERLMGSLSLRNGDLYEYLGTSVDNLIIAAKHPNELLDVLVNL